MAPTRLLAIGSAIALGGSLAACGSSNDSSSSSSSATPAAAAKGTMVSLAPNKLGKILVGKGGRTVYLFLKDKGPKSTCSGACAKVWMPLVTSGAPQAGPGLDKSLLGTTKRSDGTTQVTYNGHPLYYYDDDKKAGQTEGQNKDEFGAEWYVLSAKGDKLE